jgi:hypothetical protein
VRRHSAGSPDGASARLEGRIRCIRSRMASVHQTMPYRCRSPAGSGVPHFVNDAGDPVLTSPTQSELSILGGQIRERGSARGTLALAVTGFVITEKGSDQFRMDMGSEHVMSFQRSAARRQCLAGRLAEQSNRMKPRSPAPEE